MLAQTTQGKLSAADRVSPGHEADLAALARNLCQRHGLPVWGIGTSRGTLSVANAAARHPGAFDGLVLSAAVTRPKPGSDLARGAPGGVFGVALDRIEVPVLVLWHARDACHVTPSGDMDRLASALVAAARVETRELHQGAASGPACKGNSPHCSLGAEAAAVKAIVGFIAP